MTHLRESELARLAEGSRKYSVRLVVASWSPRWGRKTVEVAVASEPTTRRIVSRVGDGRQQDVLACWSLDRELPDNGGCLQPEKTCGRGRQEPFLWRGRSVVESGRLGVKVRLKLRCQCPPTGIWPIGRTQQCGSFSSWSHSVKRETDGQPRNAGKLWTFHLFLSL